jgi:hypothetical protein
MPLSGKILWITLAIALAAVCILGHRCRRKWDLRARTVSLDKHLPDVSPTQTIFVSVASWRDAECCETILSLFRNASVPTRVWVGLLDQSLDKDADVMQNYRHLVRQGADAHDYSSHVRRYRLPASKSRGHIPARALIDRLLYHNEKYVLVIDSHTLFTPGWDVLLCNELDSLVSPTCKRPILTMVPPPYTVSSRSSNARLLTEPAPFSFCRALSNTELQKGWCLPDVQSQAMHHIPEHPVPTAFWSGRFCFGYGRMLREVPWDPFLTFVHREEAVYMSLRLWTHGYDLYHPTRCYVASMTNRQLRPLIFDAFTAEQHQQRRLAYQRMHLILGLDGGTAPAPAPHPSLTEQVETYGLGSKRGVEAYFRFSGLTWKGKGTCEVTPQATHGLTQNACLEETMAKKGLLEMHDSSEEDDAKSKANDDPWADTGSRRTTRRGFQDDDDQVYSSS